MDTLDEDLEFLLTGVAPSAAAAVASPSGPGGDDEVGARIDVDAPIDVDALISSAQRSLPDNRLLELVAEALAAHAPAVTGAGNAKAVYAALDYTIAVSTSSRVTFKSALLAWCRRTHPLRADGTPVAVAASATAAAADDDDDDATEAQLAAWAALAQPVCALLLDVPPVKNALSSNRDQAGGGELYAATGDAAGADGGEPAERGAGSSSASAAAAGDATAVAAVCGVLQALSYPLVRRLARFLAVNRDRRLCEGVGTAQDDAESRLTAALDAAQARLRAEDSDQATTESKEAAHAHRARLAVRQLLRVVSTCGGDVPQPDAAACAGLLTWLVLPATLAYVLGPFDPLQEPDSTPDDEGEAAAVLAAADAEGDRDDDFAPAAGGASATSGSSSAAAATVPTSQELRARRRGALSRAAPRAGAAAAASAGPSSSQLTQQSPQPSATPSQPRASQPRSQARLPPPPVPGGAVNDLPYYSLASILTHPRLVSGLWAYATGGGGGADDAASATNSGSSSTVGAAAGSAGLAAAPLQRGVTALACLLHGGALDLIAPAGAASTDVLPSRGLFFRALDVLCDDLHSEAAHAARNCGHCYRWRSLKAALATGNDPLLRLLRDGCRDVLLGRMMPMLGDTPAARGERLNDCLEAVQEWGTKLENADSDDARAAATSLFCVRVPGSSSSASDRGWPVLLVEADEAVALLEDVGAHGGGSKGSSSSRSGGGGRKEDGDGATPATQPPASLLEVLQAEAAAPRGQQCWAALRYLPFPAENPMFLLFDRAALEAAAAPGNFAFVPAPSPLPAGVLARWVARAVRRYNPEWEASGAAAAAATPADDGSGGGGGGAADDGDSADGGPAPQQPTGASSSGTSSRRLADVAAGLVTPHGPGPVSRSAAQPLAVPPSSVKRSAGKKAAVAAAAASAASEAPSSSSAAAAAGTPAGDVSRASSNGSDATASVIFTDPPVEMQPGPKARPLQLVPAWEPRPAELLKSREKERDERHAASLLAAYIRLLAPELPRLPGSLRRLRCLAGLLPRTADGSDDEDDGRRAAAAAVTAAAAASSAASADDAADADEGEEEDDGADGDELFPASGPDAAAVEPALRDRVRLWLGDDDVAARLGSAASDAWYQAYVAEKAAGKAAAAAVALAAAASPAAKRRKAASGAATAPPSAALSPALQPGVLVVFTPQAQMPPPYLFGRVLSVTTTAPAAAAAGSKRAATARGGVVRIEVLPLLHDGHDATPVVLDADNNRHAFRLLAVPPGDAAVAARLAAAGFAVTPTGGVIDARRPPSDATSSSSYSSSSAAAALAAAAAPAEDEAVVVQWDPAPILPHVALGPAVPVAAVEDGTAQADGLTVLPGRDDWLVAQAQLERVLVEAVVARRAMTVLARSWLSERAIAHTRGVRGRLRYAELLARLVNEGAFKTPASSSGGGGGAPSASAAEAAAITLLTAPAHGGEDAAAGYGGSVDRRTGKVWLRGYGAAIDANPNYGWTHAGEARAQAAWARGASLRPAVSAAGAAGGSGGEPVDGDAAAASASTAAPVAASSSSSSSGAAGGAAPFVSPLKSPLSAAPAAAAIAAAGASSSSALASQVTLQPSQTDMAPIVPAAGPHAEAPSPLPALVVDADAPATRAAAAAAAASSLSPISDAPPSDFPVGDAAAAIGVAVPPPGKHAPPRPPKAKPAAAAGAALAAAVESSAAAAASSSAPASASSSRKRSRRRGRGRGAGGTGGDDDDDGVELVDLSAPSPARGGSGAADDNDDDNAGAGAALNTSSSSAASSSASSAPAARASQTSSAASSTRRATRVGGQNAVLSLLISLSEEGLTALRESPAWRHDSANLHVALVDAATSQTTRDVFFQLPPARLAEVRAYLGPPVQGARNRVENDLRARLDSALAAGGASSSAAAAAAGGGSSPGGGGSATSAPQSATTDASSGATASRSPDSAAGGSGVSAGGSEGGSKGGRKRRAEPPVLEDVGDPTNVDVAATADGGDGGNGGDDASAASANGGSGRVRNSQRSPKRAKRNDDDDY